MKLRGLAKRLAARLDSGNVFERLSAHSILFNQQTDVLRSPKIGQREDLWRHAIEQIGSDKKILVLEFGVYRGESIRFFIDGFNNPNCRFVGFDSFLGLPEDWNMRKAGSFSTAGHLPNTNDHRVEFVKGWFQNTTVAFLKQVDLRQFDDILIHYDADLYSSTLYLLTSISPYLRRYHFIFDEFWGHEARALYNFQQAYGAELEFFGHTRDAEQLPVQVFGRVQLPEIYEPLAPATPAVLTNGHDHQRSRIDTELNDTELDDTELEDTKPSRVA